MIALIVILGLAWGSFLTALSDRVDDLRSLVFGRSRCPKCKHPLSWRDLFPVLSYIFLFGRCRYCKKSIGAAYFLIEIFWALILLAIYFYFGLTLQSIFLFLSLSFLTVASKNDFDTQEVSLTIFLIGILFALIFRFWQNLNFQQFLDFVFSLLVCASLPFIFSFFTREKWMGYGDVFFALWVGSLVKYPESFVAIFVAFLSGALFGIIYLALYGRKKENKISFGPFLTLGTLVGIFFAQNIVNYYFDLLVF